MMQPALIEAGMWAKLLIDWPAKLHGAIALQFHVWGRVVGVEGVRIVVAIDRYEFRTTGGDIHTLKEEPS